MTFVVDIIAMLFGYPRAVLPELADTTFAGSSNALGWLFAVALFGISTALLWAVLCLALSGAADLVSAVLRMSMLQSGAPDAMRGRMQGVFIVVVAGGPRLGDLRAGAMVSAVSIPATMVSGGLFIVLAMAVVTVVVSSLRRYRFDDRDPSAPAAR